MNKDIVEGKWEEIKGKVRARWGRLTDDDLEVLKGNMDEIAGRLQKVYGYSREQAEREYEDFQAALDEEMTGNREPSDERANADADQDEKAPRKSA